MYILSRTTVTSSELLRTKTILEQLTIVPVKDPKKDKLQDNGSIHDVDGFVLIQILGSTREKGITPMGVGTSCHEPSIAPSSLATTI